jgi:hypothetical protein
MRMLLAGGLLMLLACATEAHAGETKAAACDAMVGVWEYVPPSAPGHAVIARQGSKYRGIFMHRLPEPYDEQTRGRDAWETEPNGNLYSVAGAWEYTCEAESNKLRLRLHWVYSSFRPQDVGSEAVLEVEPAGNEAKWWAIGPDGKRGAMGAGRRLK